MSVTSYKTNKAYEKSLNELKETFFNKFNLYEYSHEDCEYFKEIKGHELCIMGDSGELNESCVYLKKIYPNLTDRHIIELIALLSQRFSMSFAFERGYEDVVDNVLHSCINYVDENGGFAEDVQSVFKRGRK